MLPPEQRNSLSVLVVGGAGYIGSVVTKDLIEAGHEVAVYDNFSHGHRAAIHPAATIFTGDIKDERSLARTIGRVQPDAVMQFAAFIEAGESMTDPGRYFDNNTAGSLSLIRAMLQVGINRLIFSSTAAVYGNPETVPIPEDSPLKPTNVYGASKLMVEQMLGWMNQQLGLQYTALRYFNASGASGDLGEAHRPETHIIPLAIQAAEGRRPPLVMFGTDYKTRDGTNERDYIHVDDLASAHRLALEAQQKYTKGSKGEIFNIGTGNGVTNREVLKTIGDVLGYPVPCTDGSRRPGDPGKLVASADKIKSKLRWQPKHTEIGSIVETAVRWHRDHPQGYGD